MTPTIRVLIVDDHPLVREGLRAMLAAERDIQVVAEAGDGLSAVAAMEEHQPDVVLMDLRMPGIDGIEATRRIKERLPATAVIMLTIYNDDAFIIDAVQAGAGGYLLKDASRDLLCHTIRAVYSGGILVKESLMRQAISKSVDSYRQQHSVAQVPGLETLTPREHMVLELLVEGRTNREIAHALTITEDTAKKHVQSIIGKLGAADRTEAAVKAVRAGLLP